MKTFKSLILSTTTALLLVSPTTLHTFAKDLSNGTQMEGNKSVVYDSELDGFFLKNVSVDEVLDAMSSSGDFTLASDVETSAYVDPAVADELSLNKLAASTYSADYTLRVNATGAFGETVPISYTCNMSMTTVNYGGTNYAQFVSFNLTPFPALGSGSYVIAGSSDLSKSILNGGATIRLSQTIQLQTSEDISTSAGVQAGWFSIGGGTSSTAYYRGPAKTYTATYNLPLINVVQ